jgi:hypothetical protein
MATEAHGIVTNWSSSINTVFTAETHDCMEKVRPGTGREAGLGQKVRPGTGQETGLGRAGVRAPKVGALGDAGSSCRKSVKCLIVFVKEFLCVLCVFAVKTVFRDGH